MSIHPNNDDDTYRVLKPMPRCQVIDVITQRTSVRDYVDKEVTDDLLYLILDAARTAPSVHNIQPWFFGIVRGEKKQQIAHTLREHHTKMLFGFHTIMEHGARIIDNAPIIIAVWSLNPLSSRLKRFNDIARQYKENVRDYEIQSIAAAIENMWIAATGLGLGMAWLGIPAFCEHEINTLLNVQGTLIAILTLGYPKERRSAPRVKRKRLGDIVCFYQ